MPPESKNKSGNKRTRENGQAREATAEKVSTRKAATRKASARKVSESHALSPLAPSAANARSVSSTRPGVAIIGAGRLGSALALALNESGYQVMAVVARRARQAQLAARLLDPRPLALGATRLDSLPDTDLVFITTPDDEIAEVAARLARVLGARRSSSGASRSRRLRQPHRRIVLHASGALASSALAPLGEHAFSLGSLHPLVSISGDAASGARNLRGAFYCLEGEAHALDAARRVVVALGGQSFSVVARDKPLYHAAAVIASGHTVALFSLASALLARCGLSDERARQILLPLLASTLDNLGAHAPDEALTGTFARADLTTVRKHLAALEDAAEVRDALAIYALLGEHSLELATRRHRFDPSIVAEIARLLRRAINAVSSE